MIHWRNCWRLTWKYKSSFCAKFWKSLICVGVNDRKSHCTLFRNFNLLKGYRTVSFCLRSKEPPNNTSFATKPVPNNPNLMNLHEYVVSFHAFCTTSSNGLATHIDICHKVQLTTATIARAPPEYIKIAIRTFRFVGTQFSNFFKSRCLELGSVVVQQYIHGAARIELRDRTTIKNVSVTKASNFDWTEERVCSGESYGHVTLESGNCILLDNQKSLLSPG